MELQGAGFILAELSREEKAACLARPGIMGNLAYSTRVATS